MQVALNNYAKLLAEIQKRIVQTQKNIVQNVNREKVVMSWQIGKIVDEHLQKNPRADYGKKLFASLEKDTSIAQSILYQMRSFYKAYPTLPKNENDLSWSHYRSLASLKNEETRKYLEELTVENNLGVSELQKKIAKSKAEKRKSARQKIVKLKVARGQLFTYKITQEGEADLGFNVFASLAPSLAGSVEASRMTAVQEKRDYVYKAQLERVVDGDTIHVKIDLGFGIRHRAILRLAKINAPEIATKAGEKASNALKKILKDAPFLILKTNKTDIYGRYVADVFFDQTGKEKDPQKVADSGIYLSQLLLDRGLVEVF